MSKLLFFIFVLYQMRLHLFLLVMESVNQNLTREMDIWIQIGQRLFFISPQQFLMGFQSGTLHLEKSSKIERKMKKILVKFAFNPRTQSQYHFPKPKFGNNFTSSPLTASITNFLSSYANVKNTLLFVEYLVVRCSYYNSVPIHCICMQCQYASVESLLNYAIYWTYIMFQDFNKLYIENH